MSNNYTQNKLIQHVRMHLYLCDISIYGNYLIIRMLHHLDNMHEESKIIDYIYAVYNWMTIR